MTATRARASTTQDKSRPKWRWIVAGVLVLLAIVALQWLPVGDWVKSLQQWIESLGAFGPVLFALVYVVASLLFVPASALTLAAGAVFGLGWGLLLVSFASTVTAACAFLIARHLAREKLERWARDNERFAALDRAIGAGNWKIVVLLRLSPIVPFNLSNYLFGLTKLEFWPYVLASWIGMIPGTFVYVYLGDLGAAGVSGGKKSPLEWTLLGVGLVASVVAVVWVGRMARGKIEKRRGKSHAKHAKD
jgi:uncharacterized membrane protein YdjX (TVP38/TMEM64 family)